MIIPHTVPIPYALPLAYDTLHDGVTISVFRYRYGLRFHHRITEFQPHAVPSLHAPQLSSP